MKYFQLGSFNITFYGIHSQNILILMKFGFFFKDGEEFLLEGSLEGLLAFWVVHFPGL